MTLNALKKDLHVIHVAVRAVGSDVSLRIMTLRFA